MLSLACHPVYPGIAAVGNQVRGYGFAAPGNLSFDGRRMGACGSGTSALTSSEAGGVPPCSRAPSHAPGSAEVTGACVFAVTSIGFRPAFSEGHQRLRGHTEAALAPELGSSYGASELC